MKIKPRMLVFFVIDDDDMLLPDDCQITIWRPETNPAATSKASVHRWLQHVQQAYREKDISFDALSIDVNFSRDRTDPMWFLNRSPPNDICAGLYHGLAALARRRGADKHGNALPCAWEIRTVAPGAEFTVEQEVEIARAYGLLVALATPYKDDGGFLGLGSDGDASPTDQILQAFRAQPPRSGATLDSIVNLLPKWRDNFVESVRAGNVTIDYESLRALKADLTKKIGKRETHIDKPILDHPSAVITLLDRNRVACEAILLRSIFADKRVFDDSGFDEEVQPWVARLLEAAPIDLSGYVEDAASWVRAAGVYRSGADMPTDAPQAKMDLKKLPVEQRMLILISYQVASMLDPDRFRPSEQPHLAAALNTDFNYHKFSRTLRDTIDLCSVGNMSQLQTDVLNRMRHPGLNLRFAPTLCEALAGVLFACDLETRTAEGFPALHPYIENA